MGFREFILIRENTNVLISSIQKKLIEDNFIPEEIQEFGYTQLWENFIDNQTIGDCQNIVFSITQDFPQTKKVFGEIEVDNSYIDEDGEEQTLMTHHWIEYNNQILEFSKGTLKDYIDFPNLYDIVPDEEKYRYQR